VSASRAACCTACHGLGSPAEPATTECAMTPVIADGRGDESYTCSGRPERGRLSRSRK